jgi:hypothetical protein
MFLTTSRRHPSVTNINVVEMVCVASYKKQADGQIHRQNLCIKCSFMHCLQITHNKRDCVSIP